MNRRHFIACGCAGALSFSGTARAAASGPIDVHHHMLPPFAKSAVLEWLGRVGAVFPAVRDWTPEATLAALDEANGASAVLSFSAPVTTTLAADAAADMARRCNDYAAELSAQHPERLRFFATLAMPHVEAAIAEAERALALPGAAGVALLTSYDSRYLADPAFEPLFQMLDERGAVVFVHPTVAPCCIGLTPNVGTALIEFPVDTARTISELLWSGALSRRRRIKFIFSHGGGVLPMLTERLRLVGLANPAAAARVPDGVEATLRRLFVDTASVTHRPAMSAMAEQFGETQILFGSDYPWGSVSGTSAALDRLRLPRQQLRRIKSDNARALLNL